jgi:hypothetical protein
MHYYLFLDDERNPENVIWIELPSVKWVIVRSYEIFIKTIETNGIPYCVSF